MLRGRIAVLCPSWSVLGNENACVSEEEEEEEEKRRACTGRNSSSPRMRWFQEGRETLLLSYSKENRQRYEVTSFLSFLLQLVFSSDWRIRAVIEALTFFLLLFFGRATSAEIAGHLRDPGLDLK